MLALVIEVCFTERKKKMSAMVFNIARQITRLVLTGLNDCPVLSMAKPAIKNPTKNRAKLTSIAGICVPVDAYFTNTVAAAKQKSAKTRRIKPLRILNVKH